MIICMLFPVKINQIASITDSNYIAVDSIRNFVHQNHPEINISKHLHNSLHILKIYHLTHAVQLTAFSNTLTQSHSVMCCYPDNMNFDVVCCCYVIGNFCRESKALTTTANKYAAEMANWALGKLIPQLSLRPHTVASVIDLHISVNPVTESVIWWRGQWVELPAFPLCNSSHKPNMSGNSEVMFCGIFLNMPWLLILLFSLGWQYANELPPVWQSELSLHEPTIRMSSLCIEKKTQS